MTNPTILDTGPLVAFLDSGDAHHEWAGECFRRLPPQLVTCEAVLSEAIFLLNFEERAIRRIDDFVSKGAIEIGFNLSREWRETIALMIRYREVPMSLADACLVRLSEARPESFVLTTDSDFKIFRRNGRERIPLIYPE